MEAGRIYVGRPDYHLLLSAVDMQIRLSKGPKENRTRPAIDPLFRSAAVYHGPRVIGVLLSGLLDDGTAGLWAIKDQGGMAIVQEPSDAQWPDMPRSALENIPHLDYALPAGEIGPLLGRLSAEAAAARAQSVPAVMNEEAAMAALDARQVRQEDRPGEPSRYACPDCHGALFEIREGPILRYRCRTGHGYTFASLEEELRVQADAALWNALRSLGEYAALLSRSAEHAQASGNAQAASAKLALKDSAQARVEALRQVIEADPDDRTLERFADPEQGPSALASRTDAAQRPCRHGASARQ